MLQYIHRTWYCLFCFAKKPDSCGSPGSLLSWYGSLRLLAVPQTQEAIERKAISDKRGHYDCNDSRAKHHSEIGFLGMFPTLQGEVFGVPSRLLWGWLGFQHYRYVCFSFTARRSDIFQTDLVQCKCDENTKHYLTQMLIAINWRYWEAGKQACEGSKSTRASTLHWHSPGFRIKRSGTFLAEGYISCYTVPAATSAAAGSEMCAGQGSSDTISHAEEPCKHGGQTGLQNKQSNTMSLHKEGKRSWKCPNTVFTHRI